MLLSKIKITTAALLVGLTIAVVGTGLAYQVKSSQDGAGRPNQKEEPAAQKTQGVVDFTLPGMSNSVFGGGPNERRYIRHGNLFIVTSPLRDKYSIYNAETNKASTVRLPGSKESSLQVTPIIGQNFISLMLKGPKLTRLYVFSLADWTWYAQDLKEPVAGALSPLLGDTVAGYAQGRTIYAFSTKAKRWSILELPQEAPAEPGMSLSSDSIVVEYDGHIYTFSALTGEWRYVDLRSIIDDAIKSAENGAK